MPRAPCVPSPLPWCGDRLRQVPAPGEFLTSGTPRAIAIGTHSLPTCRAMVLVSRLPRDWSRWVNLCSAATPKLPEC